MEKTLNPGGKRPSASTSQTSQNQKPGTSLGMMLTPSEAALLKQDLKRSHEILSKKAHKK